MVASIHKNNWGKRKVTGSKRIDSLTKRGEIEC